MDRKVPQHFGKTLADRVDAPFFARLTNRFAA